MPTVDIAQAKSSLSKLVKSVESGSETEIIIARDGKPLAKLVSLDVPAKKTVQFGLLEGKYPPLDYENFQALDAEIEAIFYADPSWEPRR